MFKQNIIKTAMIKDLDITIINLNKMIYLWYTYSSLFINIFYKSTDLWCTYSPRRDEKQLKNKSLKIWAMEFDVYWLFGFVLLYM